MSLSNDELQFLLAYVDGQLEDDDLPDVEELLDKSDEARRVVEQAMAVGEWIRTSSDEQAKAAKADSIVDAVMSEAESLGGAKVITLERERAKRALNRQRVKEFGALAAVAALVALFYAWPRPSQAPEMAQNVPAPVASPAPTAPPSAAPSAEEAPAFAEDGVEVDTVESAHQVSVFYVPGVTNAKASSVVVWIGEDQEGH